jgi:membrane associated rhomboid family serine protease
MYADAAHLLSNTVPFVIFSYLVMLGGRSRFWTVMIISGLGVWLSGATGSVHYGASGVVFGAVSSWLKY